MNVDANPKDKAMVSLVETRRVSRVARLRVGVTNASGFFLVNKTETVELSQMEGNDLSREEQN